MNNIKYPDFIESTGYGTGGGLCGWYCRHNFIAFDPETMTNNTEKYGMQENYQAYRISQKLRQLERRIRITKRKKLLAKNAISKSTDLNLNNDLKKHLLRLDKLLKNQNREYKYYLDNSKNVG